MLIKIVQSEFMSLSCSSRSESSIFCLSCLLYSLIQFIPPGSTTVSSHFYQVCISNLWFVFHFLVFGGLGGLCCFSGFFLNLLAYNILQIHPLSCNGCTMATLHPVPAKTWVEFHEQKNKLHLQCCRKGGRKREENGEKKKKREKEREGQWSNNDKIAITPIGKEK